MDRIIAIRIRPKIMEIWIYGSDRTQEKNNISSEYLYRRKKWKAKNIQVMNNFIQQTFRSMHICEKHKFYFKIAPE